MSGLRPESGSPLEHEWEEAMGLLARMHAGITDLIVKDPVEPEQTDTIFDYRRKTTNAQDAALACAWMKLISTPFDGGDTHIEFQQCYDEKTGRPEKRWQGRRRQSTEEGHSIVWASVERLPDDDGPDTWEVEFTTEERDCDGLYTGGGSVTLAEGKLPEQSDPERRDHTAEAAGY
jgi:hypothetical protein